MYQDSKKSAVPRLLLLLLACLLVCAAALPLARRASLREIGEESAAAIAEAVRRLALQCYAVEGVYPPDLAYLENNYGLSVNHADFYITYDAFASNLPPTVIVSPKHQNA